MKHSKYPMEDPLNVSVLCSKEGCNKILNAVEYGGNSYHSRPKIYWDVDNVCTEVKDLLKKRLIVHTNFGTFMHFCKEHAVNYNELHYDKKGNKTFKKWVGTKECYENGKLKNYD